MQLATLPEIERYLDGFINRERQVSFDYEKLGLGRVRALLEAIGSPERGLACVHLTGSKGKGSSALACEALLRACGRRVGTFTSPHLESWLERFRLDGESVPLETLAAVLRDLHPVLERLRDDPDLRPSFFDVITALAFELFRRQGVDAAVFEVGLGGRLDSTNVLEPRVSVLTTVELEHTDKLGSTVEQIAREKVGIMRSGVPFVYGGLLPGARDVVLARAIAEDTPLEEVLPGHVLSRPDGIAFSLADGRRVKSAVLGAHQAANLALAVRAAELFQGAELDADALAALADLRLPGRLELLGSVILDSAHTRESAWALRRVLDDLWPERPVVLALSVGRDKDAGALLAALAPRARACVVTCAEPVRAWRPEELAPFARAAGIAHVEARDEPLAAVARARELCGPDDLVVATGSFYFAGAVRSALLDCAAP